MSHKLPITLEEWLQTKTASNRLESLPESLSSLHSVLYPTSIFTASGVYFLVKEGIVVYVGQSQNVTQRLTGHTDKEYDQSFCILVPEEKLLEVETAFIHALKPYYNTVINPQGTGKTAQILEVLDIYGWFDLND